MGPGACSCMMNGRITEQRPLHVERIYATPFDEQKSWHQRDLGLLQPGCIESRSTKAVRKAQQTDGMVQTRAWGRLDSPSSSNGDGRAWNLAGNVLDLMFGHSGGYCWIIAQAQRPAVREPASWARGGAVGRFLVAAWSRLVPNDMAWLSDTTLPRGPLIVPGGVQGW